MAIGTNSTMTQRSHSPGLVKSGVYYRNREMAKHVHPLQRLSSSTKAFSPALLPSQGKPLPPAPSLGNFVSLVASKKLGGKVYFAPPVKVAATTPVKTNDRTTSKLNAEERLFLEAVSSLRVTKDNVKTHRIPTSALKTRALAPPPFVFVARTA
mmetsp:Transcript_22343/g.48586  ORF Transcript_22343/g.48586 Transcript_22343/m.48586 type:complete len:154 (-) Transcript_22343:329-790(-)|eukprot:CAMPEP_0168741638 /NCGR_PEP_ID=MMETSP0724-20121128/12623_1 /TAXON_ID=265536 /ORGANISM="Amphiprora sp., Strain CCMP467" /LENGTH=153 /DNA_ID=CAMNT_0008789161 /DNA_START=93 /DNA_END=554 /DNA_ORIENTATION=-